MKKKVILTKFITLFFIFILTACNPNTVKNTDVIDTKITNTTEPTITSDTTKNINTQNITSDHLENINQLQKNGLEILENQSFWTNFENLGKVRFICAQLADGGNYSLKHYLINEKQDIVYSFPDYVKYKAWSLSEVKAVYFKDINNDGLKDIIIIADYVTGIGANGAIPFPISKIYFQKDKGFVNIPELDNEIERVKQNMNIDMIIKFVEKKDLNLYK